MRRRYTAELYSNAETGLFERPKQNEKGTVYVYDTAYAEWRYLI